jgi:hypothetical protein
MTQSSQFDEWGNKIEVALFIGIYCHYADLALGCSEREQIASP